VYLILLLVYFILIIVTVQCVHKDFDYIGNQFSNRIIGYVLTE